MLHGWGKLHTGDAQESDKLLNKKVKQEEFQDGG
jgi:hypothetical protein